MFVMDLFPVTYSEYDGAKSYTDGTDEHKGIPRERLREQYTDCTQA